VAVSLLEFKVRGTDNEVLKVPEIILEMDKVYE
jgi:hypothetical protein